MANGNPFFVSPPNPLDAVILGGQSYDRARQATKEAELDAAYKNIGQTVQSGGGINKDVLGQIFGLGPRGAPLLTAAAALQKDNGTELQKNYRAAVEQGFRGTLMNYDMQRRAASRPLVNIDQKGESAFSTESGKLQAQRFHELTQDVVGIKQMQSDLDTLRTLGAQIGTGKGAQLMGALGPFAQTFGIDVKGLDEIQAYEAIINRMAPGMRVKGSGSQSDIELRNFLQSLPSLGNMPGGNELITATLSGLYGNKLKAAEIGSKALAGEITRPHAEKLLRELPDPMEGYRIFIKSNNPAAAKKMQSLRKKYGLE